METNNGNTRVICKNMTFIIMFVKDLGLNQDEQLMKIIVVQDPHQQQVINHLQKRAEIKQP